MAEFTSEIKTIPYSDVEIYSVLSDLSNLELAKEHLPEDKIKNLSFDSDSCTVHVDPIGPVRFVVVSREPNSTIKFEAEKLPIDLNMWIQLKSSGEKEAKMKLTIKADLNPFLKPMVSKPLQQGLDKVADILSDLPYDEITNQRANKG